MRLSTIVLLILLIAGSGCATRRDVLPMRNEVLSLIPIPASVERASGNIWIDGSTPVVVFAGDATVLRIAQGFSDRLQASRGLRLATTASNESAARQGSIEFLLTTTDTQAQGEEGYEIDIDSEHVRVSARTAHGLFNGSVTLWQLLTQRVDKVNAIALPALRIVDAPRFVWRGAMLDSARHFQSPEFIKRFIDQLALAKLNTFHWHLTDDQGWRIEIKKYPRLADVGAWRRPAGAAASDAEGKAVRYGGYYTQEQIRDIVRYAGERYVTIVPEIDMPGHMQAAIAAYPELGSAGDTPVVSPDWGVHSYLLNTDESTFTFVSNILDEVVALFPGRYIHIGGDEAVKDQWKASPRVQARMRELGLADETALQGWFIARLQKMLDTHGRKLIGWDEILEGPLSTDATVMSWRGSAGGIEAVHKGHDVVMAPSPDLYLDHLQTDAPDEPSGRPDLRTLANIYAFVPIPAAVDADAANHVLGAQANLWTEHMRTIDLVEHAAFPRLAALAEVLWSPASTHDWRQFIERLGAQMDRYASAGVAASQTAFEVRFAETYDAAHSRVSITLSNQLALPMRYTTDGSAPDMRSPRYAEPLDLAVPNRLRASVFLDGRGIGVAQDHAFTRSDLLSRASDALRQCAGKLPLRLQDDAPTDGDRAYFNVDLFDPCWIYEQAPLDGIEALSITVGQLPYNFQLSKDVTSIVPRQPATSRDGELVVRLDSCTGAVVASLPLVAAMDNPALTTLSTKLPAQSGRHDLCFTFTGKTNQPLWVIGKVQLQPSESR